MPDITCEVVVDGRWSINPSGEFLDDRETPSFTIEHSTTGAFGGAQDV